MNIFPYEPSKRNKYWDLHKKTGLPYPKYNESWRRFGKNLKDSLYKPWAEGGRILDNYKHADIYFVDGYLRHVSNKLDSNFKFELDENVNEFDFPENLLVNYPFSILALSNIKVSCDVTLKENIEDNLVVCIDDSGSYSTSTFFNLHLEENAHLKLTINISAKNGVFSLPFINYHLDKGASIEVVYMIECDEESSMFPTLFSHLTDNSKVYSHTTVLSEGIFRRELFVYVFGEEADFSENGVSLFSNGTGENINVIEHPKPSSTSSQNVRTLSDNSGLGSWQGMAKVFENCEGTDAEQSHKGLILSDSARIHMKPQLEILTDDVTCGHGASLGKLDPEVLNYMMSRGIPQEVAKKILVEAFVRASYDEDINIDHDLHHIIKTNTNLLLEKLGN